jgi:hypothetical protein
MIAKISRILLYPLAVWARPQDLQKLATCVHCGKIGRKAEMLHSPYGWFCSDAEFNSFSEKIRSAKVGADD